MSPSMLPQTNRPHMLVRLKPYNPSFGNVSKSKSISGISFDAGEWVPIYLDGPNPAAAEALLECLRLELQEVTGGPPAFDVCTPSEAAEIRRRERMAALEKPVGQEAAKPMPPPPGAVEAGGFTPLNEPAPEHVLDLPPEVIEAESLSDEPVESDEDDEPPPVPPVSRKAPTRGKRPANKRTKRRTNG